MESTLLNLPHSTLGTYVITKPDYSSSTARQNLSAHTSQKQKETHKGGVGVAKARASRGVFKVFITSVLV